MFSSRVTQLCLAALAGSTAAFPSMPGLLNRAKSDRPTEKAKRLNGVSPGFDADLQRIDVSGAHEFMPPGHGDIRGPCPGLNALANHNYLPHDGVATITEFIEATNSIYGMGLDLAGFLAVYGAVVDGDALQWSIGGAPPPESLLDLLAQPQGLSGSHNKYETDVSPTRGDLYEDGNCVDVKRENWDNLFSKQAGVPNDEANYGLGLLTDFRAERFQQSIDQNPYFFNGPFSGVIVQPAAYTFIYRFMANKSAEFPEGRLDKEVLKSFFAFYGEDDDNLEYKRGWEKIPENWYKRAIGDEYTIPFYATDVLAAAVEYPQFLDIGGNQGEVNTFAGVDLQDLTGGVYNLKNVFSGNNLVCLGIQAAVQFLPDIIQNIFRDITEPLAKVTDQANEALSGLSCPAVEGFNDNVFGPFPGYTKLNDKGQYGRK